jgi:hypothetical protein
MKLAAFYVSVRGDSYLDHLSDRMSSDPRFAFLKTSHPHFLYFTHLVESYLQVRQIGEVELKQLFENVQDKQAILDRCSRRLKLESEEVNEKRRLLAETNDLQNDIEFDWNNFLVVETVDLDPDQFRTGTTDSTGTFRGVDPKSYLGKRAIDPEFAFLAEGLKRKKEGPEGNRELLQLKPTPEESQKPLISFQPTASSEHYLCNFCKQTIPLSMFDAHQKSELQAAEKKKTEVYKTQDYGTVNYLASLNSMLHGGNAAAGEGEPGDLSEVKKPKLLRRANE